MTLAPIVGTPYPKTGVSSGVSSAQVGVRIPRRVRGMRPLEVAVYAALWARADGGVVRVKQATLAAALGRDGRPDAIARALGALQAAGVISRRRSSPSAASTIRVLVRPDAGERYDVVPHVLMGGLGRGAISPTVLRTWLHIDQALGRAGWTSDSIAELARVAGCSPGTMQTHLQALAALSDSPLVITNAGGRGSGWMLSRPHSQLGFHASDATAESVQSPAEPNPECACQQASQAATSAPGDRSGEVAVAAVVAAAQDPIWSTSKSAWSSAQKVRGHKELSPEDLTPENPPSTRSVDRSVGDKPGSATDGRERPKLRVCSGPSGDERVREILAVIDRRWLGRWHNGAAAAIQAMIDDDRLSVRAARLAWLEHGQASIDDTGGRHVPAIRKALSIMATDIRLGLACWDCGEQLEYVGGQCSHCAPEPLEADLGDLEQSPAGEDPDQIRGRILLSLGHSLDQILDQDPDAHAALLRAGDLEVLTAGEGPRPRTGWAGSRRHDSSGTALWSRSRRWAPLAACAAPSKRSRDRREFPRLARIPAVSPPMASVERTTSQTSAPEAPTRERGPPALPLLPFHSCPQDTPEPARGQTPASSIHNTP